jgi:hypothetical protein
MSEESTDTPVDPIEAQKLRVPSRGRRTRVLGEGEGDHCIYIIGDGSSGIPEGCLIPIPNIPRFTTAANAKKWIRLNSGDLLANKQVIIFKALDIINVVVAVRQVMELQAKMKIEFNGVTDKEEA